MTLHSVAIAIYPFELVAKMEAQLVGHFCVLLEMRSL
jgi:hypothetical protein